MPEHRREGPDPPSEASPSSKSTHQPARSGKGKRRRVGWWLVAVVMIAATILCFARRDAISRAFVERMPLSMLERRVQEHPDNYQEVEVLCQRLIVSGKPGKALEVMRTVTDSSETTGALWLLRAEVALSADDDRDAAYAAQEALQSSKRPGKAHYLLGWIAQRAGDEEEAQAEFQKAVSLEPKYAPAWIKLGLYSVHYNMRGAAVDQFQHALAASPRNSTAAAGLAEAYFAMSRFPEAERAAQDAIAWQPKLADGHLWLARVLAAQGEPSGMRQAEIEFKEAIRLSANPAPAYRLLGTFYLQQGNAMQAAEALQKAIEREPYFKDTYPVLVQCHRRLGQTQEAEQLEQKYRELETMDSTFKQLSTQVWIAPKDIQLRLKLMEAYLRYGRTDLAQSQAAQLRNLAPDSPEVKAMLARLDTAAPSASAPAESSQTGDGGRMPW